MLCYLFDIWTLEKSWTYHKCFCVTQVVFVCLKSSVLYLVNPCSATTSEHRNVFLTSAYKNVPRDVSQPRLLTECHKRRLIWGSFFSLHLFVALYYVIHLFLCHGFVLFFSVSQLSWIVHFPTGDILNLLVNVNFLTMHTALRIDAERRLIN